MFMSVTHGDVQGSDGSAVYSHVVLLFTQLYLDICGMESRELMRMTRTALQYVLLLQANREIAEFYHLVLVLSPFHGHLLDKYITPHVGPSAARRWLFSTDRHRQMESVVLQDGAVARGAFPPLTFIHTDVH